MLTEKIRKKIVSKLGKKSDTELAVEFGTSRKTVWRLRQSKPEPIVKTNSSPMPTSIEIKPVVSDAPVVFSQASLAPKVDVEPVVLSTYFSLQILRGESYKDVALAFLDAADRLGLLFRKLQVLDIMTVGTTSFVRFRTDLTSVDAVLKTMTNRGSVSVDPSGGYVVKFIGGRSGKYPTSTMLLQPKLGFGGIFAGTKVRRWRAQFETTR